MGQIANQMLLEMIFKLKDKLKSQKDNTRDNNNSEETHSNAKSKKIVIIHGQSHEGSTFHIARMLAKMLHGEVTEFFLPRDFGEFCLGCTACFMDTEKKCPHYKKLSPLTQAIDDADVLILASPVYVFHATGPMKAFLDHYGWRWMVHRPEEKMFSKQAVCISTAAGGGMKSTNRDMAHSTFFWGVAKTYKLGFAVMETSWDRVKEAKKKKIDHKLRKTARKIMEKVGYVKPSPAARLMFFAMSKLQKNGFNEADANYWMEKGWCAGKRPWK